MVWFVECLSSGVFIVWSFVLVYKVHIHIYHSRHKGIKSTHKLVAKVGDTYVCVMTSDIEMSGTYAKHYVTVRYEDGSVVIVPKAAVSELDAETVAVVTTCCLSRCTKPVEAGECAKHPRFVKLACSAAYYREAKQKGQKLTR